MEENDGIQGPTAGRAFGPMLKIPVGPRVSMSKIRSPCLNSIASALKVVWCEMH